MGSAERTPESDEHVAAEAQVKAARVHLESLKTLSRNWLDMHRKSAELFDAFSTKVSETFLRDPAANTTVDHFYQYALDQTASQRGTTTVFESAFVTGINRILSTQVPEAEKLLAEANESRLLFDSRRHEVRNLEKSTESRLAEIDAAKLKREQSRNVYEQAETRFLDAANSLNAAQAQLLSIELPRFVESFSHMHRNGVAAGERFATRGRGELSRVDRFYAAEEEKDQQPSPNEQTERPNLDIKSSDEPMPVQNPDDVDD